MFSTEHPPVTMEVPELDDAVYEKCGIVGVYEASGDAVTSAYVAIEALQHRGQDGVGISYVEQSGLDVPQIKVEKALGRVATAFSGGAELADRRSKQAIAHVRYGTTETDSPFDALHPLDIPVSTPNLSYKLAHNGQFNMDNLIDLAKQYDIPPIGTDTELAASLFGAVIDKFGHIEPALHRLLPQLEGAFSLAILSPEAIYGVRDRHGVRPLVIGSSGDSIMIASEIRGLNGTDHDGNHRLNYEYDGEVRRGTYVVIDDYGVREERWADSDQRTCIFEYTYLSKADNIINGIRVGDTRFEAGTILAESDNIQADLVVPVLGSAKVYAHGYAAASGIEYSEALRKNPNRENPESDRTFIAKTQLDREAAVRQKFIVDEAAVEGKSLVVVDDSLVRGTTTRIIIQMLRDAGAKEVHTRIGSDVYSNICKFGVNVQSQEELLSYRRTIDEMNAVIGADSLMFLPLEKMHEAVGVDASEVCDGCMGGSYPTPRPEASRVPTAVLI